MKAIINKSLMCGIGILLLILFWDVYKELLAQPPSLPLPPSRPVPWGNPIILAVLCFGYGIYKMIGKIRR